MLKATGHNFPRPEFTWHIGEEDKEVQEDKVKIQQYYHFLKIRSDKC